jgi:hypothetical protein
MQRIKTHIVLIDFSLEGAGSRMKQGDVRQGLFFIYLALYPP